MRNMIEYSFEQLINVDHLKHLLESHRRLSGMAYGLYDNNGNAIASAGWQEICTRFHRADPVCFERCRESKAQVRAMLRETWDDILEYRCKNGMVNAAMPVIIEGRHLTTFFTGQFFYADDPPDQAYFIDQARKSGFNPDGYLAALERVPVLSREHVHDNLTFLRSMVRFMAESGLKSLRLGLQLASKIEQNRLIEEWHAIFGFALDLFHEAAFVIDENGHFQYVNQEACRSLGYSRDELTGMTVPDIDPDYSGEMVYQSIKRLHEIETQSFESRHRARDGRVFPVEITSTLFKHNGVKYNLSLARDISERKRSEEQALRTRKIFLDTLLDTIPIPLYYKDMEARYLGFNRAFEEFFGASKEHLLGKTVFDMSPPELAEIYSRQDTALFKQGGIQQYESAVRNTRGEVRNVVFNKAVFNDHDGSPRGLIGAIVDITEHKLTEQRLQEALAFSEGIINAIPDLLFEVDREGRYLNAWPQKPELLAAPKEKLLGRTVFDVLSPEAATIAMAGIREAEEKGLSFGNILRIDLPQGTHWFEQSISRKPGGNPSHARFLALSRDITKRISAENELKESEARYRHSSNLLESILESASSVSVYALDREYRYLAFNRRHRQRMNYMWGEDITIGMSLLDAVANDEYREKIRKAFDEVLTGRSLFIEARFVIEKDGREVCEYYENHGSPIFNDVGDVIGLTFFALNITERKKTEQALRMSQFIVDNASIGINRSDEDGHILYANEASARMLGYSREELCSMAFFDIVPDMGMQRWLDHSRLLRATGLRKFEAIHQRKDGTVFPVEVTANYLECGDETVCCSFAQDITERKRLEEMLRRREWEFRTLVENSPDIIVRYGRDLRRQYVNPALAAMIEGGTAALFGRAPSEYPVFSDAAIYEQKLEKVFAEGKSSECEVRWKSKNGVEICNLLIMTPEFGESGAVESVLVIGRDITELRRSSNTLLEKQQRLAELAIELSMAEERERRRIAADLHDIVGQDLALARIKLGLLSKKLRSNEDRELLNNAHELMNKVIKGVRSLTHLIHPPILQSSGLEAALQWLARQMGEEYGLVVEFWDDHQVKPISREAQTELYFAVRELLINVVKHAGTNRASVSLFRENGAYHIVIEDWGMGFIADNGINQQADSGGFGLFNIRRRIMHFGGVLEMDASPGNGTRATLKMPLVNA